MYRISSIITSLLLLAFLFVPNHGQTLPQQSSQVPISYGLLIDTSGSLRGRMDYVIAVGKAIVNSNKNDDETFLVRFVDSDKIQKVQDFTKDKTKLSNLMDEFYVEGGLSAITDAVYYSAQYLADKSKDTNRRHALVLITDGYDRNSYYRPEKLLTLLKEKNIRVYVIGFTALVKKDSPKAYDKAVLYLETLAQETGGRAYFPKNKSELENNTIELFDVMREP
jgi:Ca-activated chloride channel homolog